MTSTLPASSPPEDGGTADMVLGIDIGGTKVALRAEDGPRVCESTFTWAAGDSPETDLTRLAAAAAELLAGRPAAAVGVALPATVSSGVVTAWPNRQAWIGMDVGARLREHFPAVPVAVADDGDLAALAEAHALGCEDLIYAGVGTGIGGGVVLGGRPCPGLDRGSCELGHIVVDMAGPECACGRRGCVQAIASGPAMLAAASRMRGRPVPCRVLVGALASGEPWAESVVENGCAALASALVSAGELVRPALAVVGGGFAANVPGFADRVARHCRALARPGHDPAPVRAAVLGALSSLHGAVHAARLARDGATL